MPYQPGVQDISGQLRAQGKLAKVQGATEGFSNGFQAYQQNKMRNQVLQGENEGLLRAFMADPDTKQYAPEGIDKFLTKVEKGGGLTLDDNMRLNGMLNTALKTKGTVQQQQVQAQEMKVREQQMAASRQAMAQQDLEIKTLRNKLDQFDQEKQRDAAMRAKLQQFGQLEKGAGTGVLKASVQDRMNTELYGATDPMNVPATEDGQPSGGNDLLRRQVDMFNASGGYLKPTELAQDDSRVTQANAALGRAANADALAQARRDVEAAKLEAAGKPPQFVTDPNTGVTLAVHGNQMIPVREATPRNPLIAAIEDAVKKKEITPEEAVKYKKEVFKKAGEFSPNNLSSILTDIAARGGAGAQPSQKSAATAPNAGPKQVTTQAEYDSLPPGTRYIDPDGNVGVKAGPR